MTALLLAALAVACPPAPDPGAGPADLRAQARGAAASLERLGPAEAVAAEAEALVRASEAPEVTRGELRARVARFAARLEQHCRLLGLPAMAGASPADRSRLGGILSRPEFRGSRPATFSLGRWLAGIWEDLLELLGTEEAGRYAAGGRNVFFALLAGGVLVALLRALRRRTASRRASAPALAAPAARPSADPAESDARAIAALRAGDAAGAVRHAFLGLLGSLERGGRVPAGRALTNRELASWLVAPSTRAATPAPTPTELALAFADLARTFDRAIYGMAPPAPRDAEAYLERSRKLGRLVAEGRA